MHLIRRNGFTLIEVLVASLILFFSILMIEGAYKEYDFYKRKQKEYENIYITAISLMNMVEKGNVGNGSFSGIMNNLKYSINFEKILSVRNYKYGFLPSNEGNKGNFLITLYRVKIVVGGFSFALYKTVYNKI